MCTPHPGGSAAQPPGLITAVLHMCLLVYPCVPPIPVASVFPCPQPEHSPGTQNAPYMLGWTSWASMFLPLGGQGRCSLAALPGTATASARQPSHGFSADPSLTVQFQAGATSALKVGVMRDNSCQLWGHCDEHEYTPGTLLGTGHLLTHVSPQAGAQVTPERLCPCPGLRTFSHFPFLRGLVTSHGAGHQPL